MIRRPAAGLVEKRTAAEPCPACKTMIYRRIVLTEVTVYFDARLEYDGMYYYSRRHRCAGRLPG